MKSILIFPDFKVQFVNIMKNKTLIILTLGLAVILSSFTLLTVPASVSYSIDINSSELRWTAYHLAKSYSHTGHINIQSGNIQLDNGELVGGDLVIDMNSITNEDLTDAERNKKLVDDLKSERFFYAEKFPLASLKFINVSKTGSGSYDIKADLTIRGITKSIEFSAENIGTDDSLVKFSAKLEIDRTEHEVMYGWSIENAMLSNKFDLEITLVANKDIN